MILNPYRFSTTAPSTAFDGFGNASRSFNGTDDVSIPDNADIPTGAQTICTWVKFDTLTTTSGQDLITHWTTAGGVNQAGFAVYLPASGGKARFYITSDGSGGTLEFAEATDVISALTWAHVACVFSPSNHLKIYINGSLSVTSSTSKSAIHDSTVDLVFGGRDQTAVTTPLQGNLADVRIYDTDLSASDIADIYAGTNVTTNLVGHWLKDTDDVLDHAGVNDGTNNGSTYSYDNPNYGGLSTPLHYWDLTDLTATAGGGLYDQGSGAWGGLTSSDYPVRLGGGNAPDGASSCLNFSPSTFNSDHLTLSTDKAWDGGTDDISISMWVYHDDFGASSYEGLLTWRDGSGAGNRLTWMRVQTDATYDHLEFRIYDEDDNNDVAEDDTATGDLTAGQWHHYVSVWNSTTGVMDLYVDDSLYATTTTSGIGALDTTAHEFVLGSGIGGSLGLSSGSLDGRMFAVGIFNYPLTRSDISHLYNIGNGRVYADL